MRIFMFLVLAITILSCGKDRGIADDLVGEFIYEREVFNSLSTFQDPDTRGTMTFNEDETGAWIPDMTFASNLGMEWDLQVRDTKIAITKMFGLTTESTLFNTRVYSIVQNSEDSFTLNFDLKIESFIDSIPDSEQFENIILTRK